jgi:hypothetical protein
MWYQDTVPMQVTKSNHGSNQPETSPASLEVDQAKALIEKEGSLEAAQYLLKLLRADVPAELKGMERIEAIENLFVGAKLRKEIAFGLLDRAGLGPIARKPIDPKGGKRDLSDMSVDELQNLVKQIEADRSKAAKPIDVVEISSETGSAPSIRQAIDPFS